MVYNTEAMIMSKQARLKSHTLDLTNDEKMYQTY